MEKPMVLGWKTFFLVCLVVFMGWCSTGSLAMTQSGFFHCGRPGQSCANNGTCDLQTGNCSCTDSYGGYDCGFNLTGYTRDDCQASCMEGSTCYRNDTDTICLCSQDYDFYFQCNEKRVDIHCSAKQATVGALPFKGFAGIMFLGRAGLSGKEPTCQLRESHQWYNGTRSYVYSPLLDRNDDCDMDKTVIGETGDTVYTQQLTIQFDPSFQSHLDLTYNLSCVHLSNGTWTTTSSQYNAPELSNEKVRGAEIEKTFAPVSLYFSASQPWLGGTEGLRFMLGQGVSMVTTLYNKDVYDKMKVESCVFSNPSGSQNVTVIDDGCPTERSLGMGLRLSTVNHWYHGSASYVYDFNAIRFGSEPRVIATCQVRLCIINDTSSACEMPDCKNRAKRDVGVAAAMSRTKRASGSGGTEKSLSQSFNVIDPSNDEEPAPLVSASSCLQEPVVKSVAISLLVIVLVLVLVCFGLLACLCRLRVAGLKKKMQQQQQ